MQTVALNDGVAIPQIGFGTFQIPAGAETEKAVAFALSCGCRHIDTAAAYFNEADVGRDVGQVILRFEIQEGAIVFPKSTRPERIKSNLEIFDFSLTEDEMSAIRTLDKGKGMHDPDKPGVAEWLLSNYKIHE